MTWILALILCIGTPLFSEDHAIMSIYAVQSDTGEVLMDSNSDLSLMPASCMKIVTTAAALHLLGEDYRFETHLEYDGVIDQNKTLRGNLYIRGGGDPCLGSKGASDSLPWEKQIVVWADAIQKLGIQKVEGKVIGDASKWETALAAPSWNWEDLGNYYGAGACALSFHENCYFLTFKPGNKVGESADILRTDPPLVNLNLQNEVKTGAAGSGDGTCVYGSEYSSIQFVRGTIPAAVKEFTIRGAIPDPARCCADLLTQQLEERGISLLQKTIPLGARVAFHTTYSPALKEIVHWINQKSINLYAEHLLKKMGEVAYNDGSTLSGTKAVTNFWRSKNIDLAGFHMADGSGLSRKNLITTKQLVSILLKMKKTEFFPLFFESLPQKDGSMRAKSGTMAFVKGYAGYTGNIAFAVLFNQYPNHQKMNEEIGVVLADLNKISTKSVN